MIAVETAEIYPWFADSPTGALSTSGSQPYYGRLVTAGQNDYWEQDLSLRSGSYRLRHLGQTANSYGIASITSRGHALATFDGYSVSLTFGVIREATGCLVRPGALRLTVASKSGSSSGYTWPTTMARLTRTGV